MKNLHTNSHLAFMFGCLNDSKRAQTLINPFLIAEDAINFINKVGLQVSKPADEIYTSGTSTKYYFGYVILKKHSCIYIMEIIV